MAAQGGARPDPVEVSGLTSGPAAARPAPAAPAAPAEASTAYLRLTRGRFDPARYAELVPLTREIAAATHGLPGYRGQHHGLDREAGTLVAVSLWDSAEHARFERDALGHAHALAMALGLRLEPPEVYEVVG